MSIRLQKFGFTAEWLEFGIISEADLEAFQEEYTISEDKNEEHYRDRAFSRYIEDKSSISKDEIKNIFNLRDDGPDLCDLHINRICCLLHSDILSDTQLESLSEYTEVMESPLQKLYYLKTLYRKIERRGVNSCFEEIKSLNDPDINDYALQRSDLKYGHANWFSEYGGNKRIRNIAKQLSKKLSNRGARQISNK